MDEQRGDRTQFEIGGVEVGALFGHFAVAFAQMIAFRGNGEFAFALVANGLDHLHQTVGSRPVDLGQVSPVPRPVWLRLGSRRRTGGEALRFAQQFGLILFQGENPVQTQALYFIDEGGLQIQSISHQRAQEAATQPLNQILQQGQGIRHFGFAVFLEAQAQPDRGRGAGTTTTEI